MKVALLSLFLGFACAFAPERHIASVTAITFGQVDLTQSKVEIFPHHSDRPHLHHFYLELRNSQEELVDVELNEITVKIARNKQNTHVQRISVGRYELAVDSDILELKHFKFFIQNKALKHQLVTFNRPVRKHSTIDLISNENNRFYGRLNLKDKSGSQVVELAQEPEILFTGIGEASAPRLVAPGVWEFEISYPEDNQIIYISIRANGVLLENLFRFQHVEK